MTDRSALIDKAADAYMAGGGYVDYACLEAAINAIAPGLLDGTAWLAPWEPSVSMRMAGGDIGPSVVDYDRDRRALETYAAMRDAHLNPPPPSSPQAG